MTDLAQSNALLVDLETRQEAVLQQLDVLNQRIELVLAQSRAELGIAALTADANSVVDEPNAPERTD